MALLGVILVGVGLGAHTVMSQDAAAETPTATSEGFAVDPNATVETTSTTLPQLDQASRWVEIVGIALFSLGLFLMVRQMRPHIDRYPEFDLIILYVSLLLPLVSPLFIRVVGWNPVDYTLNSCGVAGDATGATVSWLTNLDCLRITLSSGVIKSGVFLIATLIIGVLVGLWWDRKRWIVAALIFHSIFLILFTSVFTNIGGWRTGMIGSLGYWLEQHGVQRGSQPWFYYLFVTPFYEFLPLIFAVAGIYLWTKRQRVNWLVWYWVLLGLAAAGVYSLANWLFNRNQIDTTLHSSTPGLLAAVALLVVGAVVWGLWFVARRRQLAERLGLERGFRELVDLPAFVGFVPSLIWWMLLAWPAYSIAGEKMPWLSTHLTVPMALLGGWYLGQRVESIAGRGVLSRRVLLAIGLTMLLIVVGALALSPLLLGQVRLGDQELANLTGLGRFLGGLVLAGGVAFLWRRVVAPLDRPTRGVAVTLAIFGVLALITIRFSYMASFVNYDYTNEYMVYAHGAPATKSIVLEQLEELSMRLHGDLSIKVAYDSDVSWPYTWYLRNYPNKVYFGDNASQSLNDSPVVIVGRKNWENVDPFLANNYVKHDYTFLWWPMEEYRQFSWSALLGNSTDEVRRGLGNPDVRQALWDIFWHRDYTKYGEVFGGTYTAGQWPVRHDLRLYIREDVLVDLWDHGVGAVSAAGLTDPYEANALALAPMLVLNEPGIAGTTEGALSSPRNVAIGPDGLIYVADTANHRIQVFDADGRFVRGWGGSGAEAGQFNEPWGLAVDETYVYVADTWNARIQKFTLAGEFVGAYGVSGSPAADDSGGGLGLFYGPREVVLFGEDQLLVTDTGNHRLQVMDRNGNFLSQVGNFGNQLGQFNEPVGLAVAPDGSVYVADTWNGRIQRLGPDLSPLGEWRVEAWFGQSINNKPYLAVDTDGRVYVTDPEGYRVLVFSPSGAYLNRFGQFGADVASLGLPNGLAIDAAGNLWVADAGNHRVLKFASIFGLSAAPAEGLPEQPVDNLDGSATADEPLPTDAAPTEAGPTD